jgi:hypothetical protein
MNMKKRAELPSVEVLFGKGEERQVIKAPKRKNVKALKREDVKTLEGAKERLSLYLPPELWEELERTKGELYRKYRLKANKSQIISVILKENLQRIEEIARLLKEV